MGWGWRRSQSAGKWKGREGEKREVDPGSAGRKWKGKRPRKAELGQGREGTEPTEFHWGILGSPHQGIPALLLPAGSGILLVLGRGCSLSHSPGLGAQRWDLYPRALPKLWKAPGLILAPTPSVFIPQSNFSSLVRPQLPLRTWDFPLQELLRGGMMRGRETVLVFP